MKAIRVSVGFNEWSKVDDFLREFRHEDDTFTYQVDNVTFVAVCETYQVDNVTFVAVCEDEDAMDWFKARLLTDFEEPVIVELK